MLFKNLALFPAEGAPIENGFLETAGGKIARLGPMSEAPAGGEGKDCAGLCAYPGFIDAHCHLGICEDALGFEGDDANEATDPCTPHLRGLDAVNVQDCCFGEALDAGVTAVLTGPGSANPIAGQFCAIKTWGRCIDDMVLRAPAAMKFAFGENPKLVYNEKNQGPVTRMATAAIIREQLYKARRYMADLDRAREDADADEPEYDAKCEALLPLLRGEIPAQMHAHRADDMFTALRIAREFGLRCQLVHGTQGHEVADLLAQRGAAVITGPLLCGRSKPELRALTPQGPGLLRQSGIPICICTDHPEVPINLLPLCAGLAWQAGLPWEEALRAITIEPARFGGIAGKVGSLAPGKDADILFYETDPLSLGAKPLAVLVEGRLARGSL